MRYMRDQNGCISYLNIFIKIINEYNQLFINSHFTKYAYMRVFRTQHITHASMNISFTEIVMNSNGTTF